MGGNELSTLDTASRSVQILFQRGWCGLSKSSRRIVHLFEEIEGLTNFQKQSIIVRYISMLEDMRGRTKFHAIIFHTGRTVVTVGSLIVPAMMSIQYSQSGESDTIDVSTVVYWFTWCISLLVTTFNGILTLFKIDKKYYFLHTTLEQLKSEAWQYIHLSGKYAGHYTKGMIPTHSNQYVFFTHNLEKIKLKQVEEEYYKATDTDTTGQQKPAVPGKPGSPESKMIAGLYTPTPDVGQLQLYQQELGAALIKAGVKVDGANPTEAPRLRRQTSLSGLATLVPLPEEDEDGSENEGRGGETPAAITMPMRGL
jgi:hypothetical protein